MRSIFCIIYILIVLTIAANGAMVCSTDSIPAEQLREVVVTAQESRGATSASVIDTTAMKHLQPSSFTDLLELLPGNISNDPNMSSVNAISLRQASGVGINDDYATTALGTLFLVDGMPINNNSELQATPDANQTQRNAVGYGVDMRRLSTDDIEKVEIIRGIPSVEYGELTSGLVKIKRKSGVSRFQARFKADNESQLFFVGKGFALGGSDFILNASLSWLNAQIDPRNNRENYKRLGASLRSDYHNDVAEISIHWNSAIDYTATFETDNNDPDLMVNGTVDSYKKRDHTLSWSNNVTLTPVQSLLLRELSIAAGASCAFEHLQQQKHVTPSRIMPMPVSTMAGSNYVDYLPMLYLADYDVYGKPVTAYAKAVGRFRHVGESVTLAFNAGGEWNMSKNLGRGDEYDLTRPLVAGNNMRPRAFSSIPAMNQIAVYMEGDFKWFPANFTLGLNLGARVTSLVGLDKRYEINGRAYVDPRTNATCVFPSISVSGYPLRFEVNAGIGQHTKMPVAAYLYPNLLYTDFEQLNYYHNDSRYRVMNVMTYVEDVTNYSIRAARNLKWEVRSDISYRGNRLSVTYFSEQMNNGFRHAGDVHRYQYNRYDASQYDPYLNDRAPDIDQLPYKQAFYQTVRSKVTNGSRTSKRGVEFTLQSRRIAKLKTRLTVTGAWFQTTNSNSDPLWYKPGIVIGGNELQYIGLYDDEDGSKYESFNTNFLFDTDVPRLNLNFSIGIQNMWYTSRQTLWKDGIPTIYVDLNGIVQPYTAESMDDPYLTQLIRHYAATAFERVSVPISTTINLKATKTFWHNRIGIALYVNRLFAIMPDYERYGVTMRRYTTPYFGMEINLKL